MRIVYKLLDNIMTLVIQSFEASVKCLPGILQELQRLYKPLLYHLA